MNKHTPGDWYVTGEMTRYINVRIGGGLIQEVAACGPTEADGGYGPQQEANARLMSAAPDLLEALQQYGIGFSDEAAARAEFGDHEVARELKRRAAIAKATGEQP